MGFADLERHLPNPGATYWIWDHRETFMERIGAIASATADSRERHYAGAGGGFADAAKEFDRKIGALEEARSEVKPGGAADRELWDVIQRMKQHRGMAVGMRRRGNGVQYFEDALFELIATYAENAGADFAELSPGSSDAPSRLVHFVAEALAMMGEHRAMSTVFGRVNKAIKLARECR